jgi:hypothetical protein
MNQAPALEHMVKGAKRVLPFERVVLVLQGGGALGAYQAGVYQAIDAPQFRGRTSRSGELL